MAEESINTLIHNEIKESPVFIGRDKDGYSIKEYTIEKMEKVFNDEVIEYKGLLNVIDRDIMTIDYVDVDEVTVLNVALNRLYGEIEIPEGIGQLICSNNNISGLTLPNGLITLYCDQTNIKELTLPRTLEKLVCDNKVNVTNLNEFLRNNEYFYLEMR